MGGIIKVRKVGRKRDRKERQEYVPAEPGTESIDLAPCDWRWFEWRWKR